MTATIQKISQNTLIPISFAIVLAGGIFWLSKMYFTAEANRAAIEEIKTDLKQIDRRTATIEGLLKQGGKSGRSTTNNKAVVGIQNPVGQSIRRCTGVCMAGQTGRGDDRRKRDHANQRGQYRFTNDHQRWNHDFVTSWN